MKHWPPSEFCLRHTLRFSCKNVASIVFIDKWQSVGYKNISYVIDVGLLKMNNDVSIGVRIFAMDQFNYFHSMQLPLIHIISKMFIIFVAWR
ncbi:MAG TPA: hypothetical protein VNV85_17935 [Puia sp.]|jgi:hypothetical protein|nr:hypothetical protein [Puia sp.]